MINTTRRKDDGPRRRSSLVIWVVAAIALALLSVPRAARAQDALDAARSLYAAAAYEEALGAIQALMPTRATLPAEAQRELEELRFLCLLAVDRTDEARLAMASAVTLDPQRPLDRANVSPRVTAMFEEVRRELLPQIAADAYARAKATFDRREYAEAEAQFEAVVQLLEDPALGDAVDDLRTLARGFLDLSHAAATPPPAPPAPVAAAAAEPAAAPAPARPPVITPPVALRQDMPPVPVGASRFGALRSGELEILIDEEGKVESAKMLRPIHPLYDPVVLGATKAWRYKPARSNDVPIKFRKTIRVNPAQP